MKRSIILVLIVVLCFGVAIEAAKLDTNVIDANAGWVFHADYDQFNKSTIGSLMKQQIAIFGLDSHLKEFSDKFAFDPIEDVNGVTIYGQGEHKEKAVAFVYANFDEQVLRGLLEKDSTYKIIEYKNRQIHSFKNKRYAGDEGQLTFGLLYTKKMMILSTGLDATKTAIDNLDAKEKKLNHKLMDLLGNDPYPTIVCLAGADVAENISPKNNSIVLKQTDSLAMFIGEHKGLFYVDTKIKTYTEEAALNIENMIRGFVAMGMLANEEYPEMAKLAQAIQVSRTGKDINVYAEAKPELILLTSMKAWQKKMELKNEGLNH